MTPEENPYLQTPDKIEEPPRHWLGRLRYLGPGFILSASIVGSGELIATTTLGAEAGFVLLWVILVSCLVKVTLQLEFGKHAIASGETTMQAFNQLPGGRWGKANWSIWLWLALMALKFLQVGAIIGLVGVIADIILPLPVPGGTSGAIVDTLPFLPVPDGLTWSIAIWTLLMAVVVSLLIFHGYYRTIEKLSLILIGLFTIMTLASVLALQGTEFALSAQDLLSGLSFQLPVNKVMLFAAIGAFGITGVGGDEIMHYNYWLLEKGYAAKTGPRQENDAAWAHRAKGWIKVMYLDAILAMVVYTVMTAAFYILGAAVLHSQGGLPDGTEIITTLSKMYTETLGKEWANAAFLVGAFVVLFSTLFAALGAWTRGFADAFGQIGWIDFFDARKRRSAIAILAWIIPLLWAASYFFMGKPKLMVLLGGAATTAMLVIVLLAACHFRFKRLPAELKPTVWYDIAFFVSAISIGLVAAYSLIGPFLGK